MKINSNIPTGEDLFKNKTFSPERNSSMIELRGKRDGDRDAQGKKNG
ncbi:hypothetical protein [Aquimarina spinulae]|nr:hypothetical protein [Aquimarina spinulae]